MACRVGMTSDLYERQRHWERQHPGMYGWEVLESGLTYDKALRSEEYYAKLYGCRQEGGGARVAGSVYSIYKFSY